MGMREKWQRKFMKSLRGDEKKAFRLWIDFSEGKISEKEFKTKIDMNVMPKVLGKMNATRLDTIEQEIDNMDKRLRTLERKPSGKP